MGGWIVGVFNNLFQSTLLQEERHTAWTAASGYISFQSTLLQEERQNSPSLTRDIISYFNPRSYKRSDRIGGYIPAEDIISIHAPTRGATLKDKLFQAWEIAFQSTLLQEERQRESASDFQPGNFNPRSYKRSDLPRASTTATKTYFNPRSYKRSDNFSSSYFPFTSISIHAPTRGATAESGVSVAPESISIHAPTRGATRNPSGSVKYRKYFNPRSYKRSDFDHDENPIANILFQSTLLQEERLCDVRV